MIDPHAYRALVIAQALELWAKHRLQANTAYTPSNMMRAAHEITGLTFTPRDYLGAAKALRAVVAGTIIPQERTN